VRPVRARHLQPRRPDRLHRLPCAARLSPPSRAHPQPDAHHRFINEECDWGFTRFSELRKLSVAAPDSRPTIEDDTADISVFVRVLEDPTGVLWHNFVKCVRPR
jgi:hypothetical protein